MNLSGYERQVLEFLRDSGLVSKSQYVSLGEDLKDNSSLKDLLVANSILTEDDLRKALSHVLSIPFISLNDNIGFEHLSNIPEPVSRQFDAIAFNRFGDEVHVAILDIDQFMALKKSFATKSFNLIPYLTDSRSIARALVNYQKHIFNKFGKNLSEPLLLAGASEGSKSLSVESFILSFLQHAHAASAEEIVIEPGNPNDRVRYRVFGKLFDAMTLSPAKAEAIRSFLKSRMAESPDSSIKTGKLTYEISGVSISANITTISTLHGERTTIVFSSQPRSFSNLESIGILDQHQEKIADFINTKHGLAMLVGEGLDEIRETIFSSILEMISEKYQNIFALVENPLPVSAKIRHLKNHDSDHIAHKLKAIIRQNPDVILIDIVSRETFSKIAPILSSFASSRKVIVGVKERNSWRALRTFVKDQKDSLFLHTLHSIFGVTNVLQSPSKKESFYVSSSHVKALAKICRLDLVMDRLVAQGRLTQPIAWEKIPFYREAKNVEKNKKNIAALEVLFIDPFLREMISRQTIAWPKVGEYLDRQGLQTIAEDLVYKAAIGLVTLDEAFAAIKKVS